MINGSDARFLQTLKTYLHSLDDESSEFSLNLIEILPDDADKVLRSVILTMFYDELFGLYGGLKKALTLTESPIERYMLFALTMVLRNDWRFDSVVIVVGKTLVRIKDLTYTEQADEFTSHVSISSQAIIGDYRVDFLVRSYAGKPPEMNVDPATLDTLESVEMVVECDGHDYHERTKEQAKRDKKRDRYLQSVGHKVFHYTGSEIWEDVLECALEVVNQLANLYTKPYIVNELEEKRQMQEDIEEMMKDLKKKYSD